MAEVPQALNFGPHTADVLEVVEFIQSGLLLRGVPLDGPPFRVIHDLAEADLFQDPPSDAPDGTWNWRDIRRAGGTDDGDLVESEERRLLGHDMRRHFSALRDVMYHIVKRQLDGLCSEQHIQEILGDHEAIAEARAAFGPTLPLLERTFVLNQIGGYPCGWDGIYPSGRMVVYFPAQDDALSGPLSDPLDFPQSCQPRRGGGR